MSAIHSEIPRSRPHIRSSLLMLLLALLFPGTLPAQQNLLKFDRLTSEQGLSDNFVLCMMQDSQGLIWFGTRDGLNRYDGYGFTVYRPIPNDPRSLSDGGIERIIEDRRGRIWVGTQNGDLNRFDRATGTFLRFVHDPHDPSSIPGGTITSFCEQGDYIWITTAGTGTRLCKIDTRTGEIIRYPHSPDDPGSISSSRTSWVTADRSGRVWVATDDAGLNLFDPATGRFINGRSVAAYAFAATGPISRMHADIDGTLWLWNQAKVVSFNPATGRAEQGEMLEQYAGGVQMGIIYAIHHDRQGLIWLGGSNGGTGIISPGDGNVLHIRQNDYDPYSISSNRVYCMMEDRAGNIWLGTDNGVSKFNRRNWQPRYYQHDPLNPASISHKVVRNIIKDRHGDLWIATEIGGVNRISGTTGAATRYPYYPERPWDPVDQTANVLYEDSAGYIWAGRNSGLARIDPRTGRFRPYLLVPPDGQTRMSYRVWSILDDRNGSLWIGTFGGLFKLHGPSGQFTYYPSGAQGPASNVILSLYRDTTGDLWVGTEKGLSRLDSKSGIWRHYRHDSNDGSSTGSDRVWYIHKDRDGIFWLATSGGGLNRLDPGTGKFRHFTEQDGLANNIVCGILEDDRGRLWISTTRGISVFDRTTEKFRNYGLQDGFYVQEFHFKSCYKDERGYFYFGGYNGVITFHPDSIGNNLHPPDIILTSFKVFNNDRTLDMIGTSGREIRLAYDSNFFSFGFAALDFTNSRRNQYRYRLEGFDNQWRETDGRHPRAEYTNVPPGRYTFRVQGSNSDGIWNGKGISTTVEIEPAYWQTWWFRTLAILAAGGTVAAVVAGRIRGIRRRGDLERKMVEYQLKALRAQMNPHFIFNSLNSILLFMLDHDTDAAHLYLTKFSRLMRSTLEHSNSESIPLAEELEALKFYLDLEALRMDNSFTYSITMAPDILPDEVMIPPMLIQPYAENAIMHGLKRREPGGHLAIDIRLETEWILCSVTDNGIGREQAAALSRNHQRRHRSRGMQVTRERLEILGSLSRQSYRLEVIDLNDDKGTPLGTRVEIRIPAASSNATDRNQQEPWI